jgi:hypothetical protein
MYAGTTIRRGSGKIVGVHQKIDRAARRHIKRYIPELIHFPAIQDILRFEGINGPDGIKRKSPATDEPWHFINPEKPEEGGLIDAINDHMFNLSSALKDNNNVRASFEAAWLAHAVVDGLTPSHHYPLAEKIEELWGKAHDERSSIREKNVIHGANLRDTLSKNWEYWGLNGVFTSHGMFEIGVASAIATENFKELRFNKSYITKLEKVGFKVVYLKSMQKINDLHMFEHLTKSDWTGILAKQTREILIPEMIRMVILAWYQAVIHAKEQMK